MHYISEQSAMLYFIPSLVHPEGLIKVRRCWSVHQSAQLPPEHRTPVDTHNHTYNIQVVRPSTLIMLFTFMKHNSNNNLIQYVRLHPKLLDSTTKNSKLCCFSAIHHSIYKKNAMQYFLCSSVNPEASVVQW